MQLAPCERPSRDAVRPYATAAPARYSLGAAAGYPGRPHQQALPPPTSARLLQRLLELPRAARPEGSLHPCGRGDVATPIHPITGWPSLAPSSFTRGRVGPSCELPTRRDGNGLTTFRRGTARGVGRASSPGERHLRAASSEGRSLSPCLLAQACQPLWPVITNGVYQRFTCVDRPSRSWFPTALRLAVAASAHASAAIPEDEVTLSRRLRTPPLPATHAPVGYCWQNSR
jgi:hypothetical protein